MAGIGFPTNMNDNQSTIVSQRKITTTILMKISIFAGFLFRSRERGVVNVASHHQIATALLRVQHTQNPP
jgi:hypothetical protein